MDDEPAFLTLGAAARLCNRSKATISRAVRAGRLPAKAATDNGTGWLIRRDDLDRVFPPQADGTVVKRLHGAPADVEYQLQTERLGVAGPVESRPARGNAQKRATPERATRYSQASTYHQLGRVAEEQRRWAEAEAHYKQALAIKVEFNDRYSQASTYHQLGVVAQEQRRWAEAEQYYRNDLEISKEFEDWHGVRITIGSIARLWRASGEATIPAMVADALGVSRAEAEQLLRKALDGEEAPNAES